MLMKKIICISGKQYSGKDTLAKIFLKHMDSFKRLAIGDAIKIEFGRINNLTYDEIDSNKGIYRTGLIELGNKGRAINPDYWLNKIIEMDENLIVPDIRLTHEADVFKNAGAFLIRVEASYETRSKRGVITNAGDLTETALDDYKNWDYVISNDTDYNALEKSALPLIQKIENYFIRMSQNNL